MGVRRRSGGRGARELPGVVQKRSESYQADLLAGAVETFRERDSVTGFTVWQYCDTRTDRRKEMGRPESKNNKGIVDEYRRPEEAYRAVQELLTGERR